MRRSLVCSEIPPTGRCAGSIWRGLESCRHFLFFDDEAASLAAVFDDGDLAFDHAIFSAVPARVAQAISEVGDDLFEPLRLWIDLGRQRLGIVRS